MHSPEEVAEIWSSSFHHLTAKCDNREMPVSVEKEKAHYKQSN